MAEQTVALTQPGYRTLRRVVNRVNRLPVNLRKELEGDRVRESRADNRIHFKNDSGETVPAWGVMAVTGIEQYGDRIQYVIDKPDTTFRRMYLVNSSLDVADAEFGIAQPPGMTRVLYDTGATPAALEGWGPKPASWLVWQKYPETLLVAGEHDDEETLIGEWHSIDRFFGEAANAITKGTSNDCTPFKGTAGSESTAGFDDVTARNAFGDIDAGAKVVVFWFNGQPYVTQAECPA